MILIDELFGFDDSPPPGFDWTGGSDAARLDLAACSFGADGVADDLTVAPEPLGIPCIVFLRASISGGFCINTENPCFCR